MKVKLFGLAALILLSAISSIFNAMPMIGVSAQDYRTADDYGSSYGSNNNNNYDNGMVDNYSYEEPNTYNTDNSYGNGPANYGNEEKQYSSYDNSYGYPSNTGYMDDSYSPGDPGSYGNQYNNYYAQDSYEPNYYPPVKPKKFTCPDSGLVVDKPENCPVICPLGSTLEGHFVKSGSNLTQICNVDQQVLETCPAGTDLEGVFVTDATIEQCNIFATCDANTPLGEALDLNATETVEVADPQLCQLEIPAPVEIFQCPSITEDPLVNPLLADANVTDIDLCFAATPAVQCPDTSPLDGVWVDPEEAGETCNIVIPPPVDLVECPSTIENPLVNPLLAGSNVTDIDLCFAATPAVQCGPNTTLNGTWVNPDFAEICDIEIPPSFLCEPDDPLSNAIVTDPRLCQFEDIELFECPEEGSNPAMVGLNVTALPLCEAPNNANICGIGTDLEGVFVNNTSTDCDLDVPITPEAQCIKCADLASDSGNSQQDQNDVAEVLIGNNTNNVFTICNDTATAKAEFNATIADSNGHNF